MFDQPSSSISPSSLLWISSSWRQPECLSTCPVSSKTLIYLWLNKKWRHLWWNKKTGSIFEKKNIHLKFVHYNHVHCLSIKRFPEMGVPPCHPFLDGYSILKPSISGYPHLWKPPFRGLIGKSPIKWPFIGDFPIKTSIQFGDFPARHVWWLAEGTAIGTGTGAPQRWPHQTSSDSSEKRWEINSSWVHGWVVDMKVQHGI